jgi:hypothetical protein
VTYCFFSVLLELPEDGLLLEPLDAEPELSLFEVSLLFELSLLLALSLPEDDGLDELPDAAEPEDLLSDFCEDADPPLEAEPLMPILDIVCWSSWPVAFRPFCCWYSRSAFCVCGPILPSAVTLSFSCTCLMVSSSCMPPLLPADAEDEAPFDCLLEDAPEAAEPCDDLSLEADDPLEAGELALPEPDCDWVADGVCALCDSCFFSCATAPSDSIAAATATAMTLNLMKSPFLGYRSVGLRRKASKQCADRATVGVFPDKLARLLHRAAMQFQPTGG